MCMYLSAFTNLSMYKSRVLHDTKRLRTYCSSTIGYWLFIVTLNNHYINTSLYQLKWHSLSKLNENPWVSYFGMSLSIGRGLLFALNQYYYINSYDNNKHQNCPWDFIFLYILDRVYRYFIVYSALHRLTNIKGNIRLTLLVLLFLYWDNPFFCLYWFSFFFVFGSSLCFLFALLFLYSEHLFVFCLCCFCIRLTSYLNVCIVVFFIRIISLISIYTFVVFLFGSSHCLFFYLEHLFDMKFNQLVYSEYSKNSGGYIFSLEFSPFWRNQGKCV
jgi:hypothetical protein